MCTDSYNEVFAWLRGGVCDPDPQMQERFLEMVADRVMVKMGVKMSEEEILRRQEASRRRARRARMGESPLSLKSLMKRVQEEESNEVVMQQSQEDSLPWESKAEVKTETEALDSVVVAKALQWMATLHDLTLNMSQLQTILYNAYGVWLARNGERLLAEHPQVWKFGPVFPRAYKHLKKNVGTGEVEYDMLRNDHPAKYAFISKCFFRFAWTSACVLTAPHVAEGSPWRRVSDANNGKLGVHIDDNMIAEWFRPQV